MNDWTVFFQVAGFLLLMAAIVAIMWHVTTKEKK